MELRDEVKDQVAKEGNMLLRENSKPDMCGQKPLSLDNSNYARQEEGEEKDRRKLTAENKSSSQRCKEERETGLLGRRDRSKASSQGTAERVPSHGSDRMGNSLLSKNLVGARVPVFDAVDDIAIQFGASEKWQSVDSVVMKQQSFIDGSSHLSSNLSVKLPSDPSSLFASQSLEEYQSGLIHDRDVRDKDRDISCVRQKDVKERGPMNGVLCSSSSRSDSDGSVGDGGGRGPKRCGYSTRTIDREPGELSSESGSDGAVGSESQSKDCEISRMGNGKHCSPVTRKRKFSPIVWDRDDKEVRSLSKSKLVPPIASRALSLLNSGKHSSRGSKDDNVQMSPVKNDKSQELFPLRGLVEDNHMDNASSEVEGNLHCESPVEQQWGNCKAEERRHEEDYVTTRNISASRWAGDANSPADEGEISEEEDMLKRKKRMLKSELLGTRLSKVIHSPEPGEVKFESTEHSMARKSDTFGGMNSRPSTRNHGLVNDLEDQMEMDGEHFNSGTSLSQSDTDSASFHETPEPLAPSQRTVNMLHGCRSVDEFERLNKIDEGTYGVVYRAKDKKTGEIVALKKVKMEKEREGFPMTSLREINILLSFYHPSVVDVKEVVVGSSLDSIFMVMEYMEHDLKGLMESMKQPFSQSEVKCLMLQLLEGCKYLHDNWVLHRDLKTSNVLLNNQGELKICDFGLARQYGIPLKPYTHMVVTLWYRAPELLLGAKQYSTAIDMWSLGCIMAELLSKEPLFNGKSEFDQLDKIFRILGTPNETIWPGFSKLPGVKVNFVKHQYNQLRKKFPATSFTGSPVLSDAGFDLLNRLLTYDPEKRIMADEALKHEWFREVPLPKSKEFMPTFPAQHAQDRRMRRVLKSPDPLQEQRRRELQQVELGAGGLFG